MKQLLGLREPPSGVGFNDPSKRVHCDVEFLNSRKKGKRNNLRPRSMIVHACSVRPKILNSLSVEKGNNLGLRSMILQACSARPKILNSLSVEKGNNLRPRSMILHACSVRPKILNSLFVGKKRKQSEATFNDPSNVFSAT